MLGLVIGIGIIAVGGLLLFWLVRLVASLCRAVRRHPAKSAVIGSALVCFLAVEAALSAHFYASGTSVSAAIGNAAGYTMGALVAVAIIGLFLFVFGMLINVVFFHGGDGKVLYTCFHNHLHETTEEARICSGDEVYVQYRSANKNAY